MTTSLNMGLTLCGPRKPINGNASCVQKKIKKRKILKKLLLSRACALGVGRPAAGEVSSAPGPPAAALAGDTTSSQ